MKNKCVQGIAYKCSRSTKNAVVLGAFLATFSAYGIIGDTIRESQERYGPPTGILNSENKAIYVYEYAGFTISQSYSEEGICIESFRAPNNESAKQKETSPIKRPQVIPVSRAQAIRPGSVGITKPVVPKPALTIPHPTTKNPNTSTQDRFALIVVFCLLAAGVGFFFAVIRKTRKTVSTVKKYISTVQNAGRFVNQMRKQPESEPTTVSTRYKGKKSALTENEIQFHKALQKAVNNRCSILFQVSLGQLIDTCQMTYSEERSARNRIDRKVLDFVLCDSDDLATIAVIELDDKTHLRPARIKRDRFLEETLKEADVPLIRFWSTAGSIYDPKTIESKIAHLLPEPKGAAYTQHLDEDYYKNYSQACRRSVKVYHPWSIQSVPP